MPIVLPPNDTAAAAGHTLAAASKKSSCVCQRTSGLWQNCNVAAKESEKISLSRIGRLIFIYLFFKHL